MKKSVGLLLIGLVIGVLIWGNVQRWMGRNADVPMFGKGGDVLPPPAQNAPVADFDPKSPTRAAAAVVEQVVVNIDIRGKGVPVATDIFGFTTRYVYPEGSGSGVIIRPDGFIVTNNHVIAGAQEIAVTLHNGQQIPGTLWGRDPMSDLAVVKVNKKDLPYARLADSDKIKVGDPVIAVGNALGLGTTVTSGIVSATERYVVGPENNRALEKAIQTDAAINRGNSGGALALLDGEVVGINTAIFSTNPGGGNIGIGFSIPSNTVRQVVTQLISEKRVERAWMGVSYRATPDLAEYLQQRFSVEYPNAKSGIVVMGVAPNSPAADAGLRELDQIRTIDGKTISNEKVFSSVIHDKKPGDKVELTLWRPDGKREMSITVTLGQMPASMEEPQPAAQPRRGLQLPF